MEPTYHLEGVIHSKEEMEDFEGPLNLILMLLSKNKIEIRDIKISEILDQYLQYLAQMEEMDLEIASEFVQMASHLLYIKTKMLLTSQEEVSELEMLISSLEQLRARDAYSSVREVVPELSAMSEKGFLLHVKPPEPIKINREYRYRHEPVELLRAVANICSRGRTGQDEDSGGFKKRIVPRRIVYNVRDKSREILERFRSTDELRLSQLYSESESRSEIVAVFISVLELCSIGDVHIETDGDDIVLSFAGRSVDSSLEAMSQR